MNDAFGGGPGKDMPLGKFGGPPMNEPLGGTPGKGPPIKDPDIGGPPGIIRGLNGIEPGRLGAEFDRGSVAAGGKPAPERVGFEATLGSIGTDMDVLDDAHKCSGAEHAPSTCKNTASVKLR